MAGIYIHIPFCKQRCRYCSFFSSTNEGKKLEYVDALCQELRVRNSYIDSKNVESVYIGGGTPSTLQHGDFEKIFDTLERCYHVKNGAEITLEANPDDLTREYLAMLRNFPFNRLSMGVQSFDDSLLNLLGRRHDANRAVEAFVNARAAGFANISIDLMFALPGSSHESWSNDLETAVKLSPEHISAYNLTYEEGTSLYRAMEDGTVIPLDEDGNLEQFSLLIERLGKAGYRHYEISNFAKPGCESRHNSSYWNDTPYIGLGAGAHSYNGQQRQWNISDLDTYIQQANTHQLQPQIEQLTDEQRHIERIMLGLRTRHGVAANEIPMQKAQGYINRGLLSVQGNRIVATTQGYHILNTIIEDLLT